MNHRQSNLTRVFPNSAIGILAWALAVALLAMAAVAGTTTQPAQAVDRIAIVVSDADRAAEFFKHVLDFRAVSDQEVEGSDLETLNGVFGARCRMMRLVLGDESVELIEYLTPRGAPVPADSRSNDRWFQHIAIITSDMNKAYDRLRTSHVRYASIAPQTLPNWNVKAAGIKAFYFLDPDGHVLEVLQFPEGKGESRWHRRDRLFLGIDHTAIVTANTDRSLAFYRDRLGMRVADESENWGDEQEHLNNVQGAHLRITTLRAPSGPGVELLEYLKPGNGRDYPSDGRANDLFAWQTVLRVPDVASVSTLFAPRARVSTELTRDPLDASGARAWIGRDPDGHLIELIGSTDLGRPHP